VVLTSVGYFKDSSMTIPEAISYTYTRERPQYVSIKANGRKHYHALCGKIIGVEDMSILFQDVYGEKIYKFGLSKIVSCQPVAIRPFRLKMPKKFIQ